MSGYRPNMDDHEGRLNQEIDQLVLDIRRIGPTYPDPQPRVLFGELFDDEQVEQYYEALVGTLKSAKKRGIIHFKGQILFKGVHDRVVISIVDESPPPPKKIGQGGDVLEATKKRVDGAAAAVVSSAPVRPPGVSDRNRRKTVGVALPATKAVGAKAAPAAKTPPSARTATLATTQQRKWTSTRTLGPASRTAVPLEQKKSSYHKKKPMAVSAVPNAQLQKQSDRRTPIGEDSLADSGDNLSVSTAPAQLQPVSRPTVPLVRRTSSMLSSAANERVAEEIARLPRDISRISPEGEPWCLFGDLFDDDEVQQNYEALVGTLKSAKKRGVVRFKGQMLLKGMHDGVKVEIVQEGRQRQTGKGSTKAAEKAGMARRKEGDEVEGAAAWDKERRGSTKKAVSPAENEADTSGEVTQEV